MGSIIWYEVEHNGIEYNIRKPYKKGRLHEWDSSTPESCNFGICLTFRKIFFTEKMKQKIIKKTGNKLAKEFATMITYHRTWYEILEKDTIRNIIFEPK